MINNRVPTFMGEGSMFLDGTPGQRLGVYTAEPGTPDYDAMILLDMTAPKPDRASTAKDEEQQRTDS
ncbi:hypothetical protein ACFVIY_39740 [Streptomyces sp. NPDC127166]|uniref:hypothetical protein n=1 Tax=Streptomyces sp. NPDC127166 TaxID=3345380 RepID=UPI003643F903